MGKYRKRKFCWYDVIIIISVIVTIGLIFLSYIYSQGDNIKPWLSNMLMSLATSLLFGAILTYVFALLSARNNLIQDARRELTEIIRNLLILSSNLSLIWNDRNKNIKSIEIIQSLPTLYNVNVIYQKYGDEYKTFRDNLIDVIKDNSLEECLFKIHTMGDITLKVQELFYQEYLGVKKEPIKGQVVHRINDPIVDYGAIYSNRRRKFKKQNQGN